MKKQPAIYNSPDERRLTVGPGLAGERLDAGLAALFPEYGLRARRRLWEWCAITVDGLSRSPAYKLKAGQEIHVKLQKTGPKTLPETCAETWLESGPKSAQAGPKILLADDLKVLPGMAPEIASTAYSEQGREPRSAGPWREVVYTPRIVKATADYLAFYKPAGLPSAALSGGGGASMESLIAQRWPEIWREYVAGNPGSTEADADLPPLPLLCNRLDTATSGLLLAAFGAKCLERFRAYERAGKAKKKYLVLAHGRAPAYLLLDRALDTRRRKTTLVLERIEPDFTRHSRAVLLRTYDNPGEVDDAGGGKALAEVYPDAGRGEEESAGAPGWAQRRVEEPEEGASDLALGFAAGLEREEPARAGLKYLVDLIGPLSLLEVTILRGARHQIRAHLARAGFPIVGDTQYGLESTGRAGGLYLHHSEISLPGFRAEAAPQWGIFTA